MAIRISGLNSGLDTESMVKELVSAYSLKTEKYEKSKTKLEWKQDAWKSLNTKIYSFYTNISNLRYSSAYNMKKTNVSDSTKAKITASSNAVIGTQTLSVNNMAQSGYLTGAKLKLSESALENSTDKKVTGNTTLAELGYKGEEVTLSISDDKQIKVTKDTKISELVTNLKDMGLNASFDENNQRIFISAKESGKDADFSLSDGTNNNEALKTLGLYTYDVEQGLYDKYYPETGDNVKQHIENLKSQYNEIVASGNVEKEKEFREQYEELFEKDDNGEFKKDTDGKFILISGDKVDSFSKQVSDTKQALENKAVKIDGSDAEIVLNGVTYTSSSNSFSINGLTIEATGVTDENNPISITTSTDTQGIYDKIKDFLTEYNNIINEMTKLYNADSSKKYEPLTSDEKEAMSDDEVEKWENKIKDALLRRDTTLNNIMSGMMNSMSQAVTLDDGTKLSLSNFGIQTLGFLNSAENEQNAYHIDGDEDDPNSSGKTDKLMKAIQENPDQVCEFMKKLASNLYNAIDTKMKSTSLSSAYKVYNDKELDNQLKNYTKLIKDWEEKVAEKEDYYYKKFSAMETALSKLNSQSSSLSGLIGQ